jgi:starch phosphorylase
MTTPTSYLLPTPPEGLESLAELALDLSWSWNYTADALWGRIAPELWPLVRNPWFILQTVSDTSLQLLAADPAFRELLDAQTHAHRQSLEVPSWFQEAHPLPPLSTVAYFSMEFGLSEALPIYSGGLGILAGDHLKTASDLGIPVVGVGILYQQGYFRQTLDPQGAQMEFFPYNDPGQLPITPVRAQNGEWLRVALPLPGRSLWLRIWEARVGRVQLYLLDSNDPVNSPADRGINAELYGGGPELRLQQEIVLGIGGWRLLCALGIEAEVCHLNEGHAALAVLERARTFMKANRVPFEIALTVTRAGNLFTTHTSVAAGFDRFTPALVQQYLGAYADELGLGLNGLLALGRTHPTASHEPFNMAYLAIRGSGALNGVSGLHGAVSRRIFAPLFPRWPEVEVPVGHITNGIHVPSWESAEADELWAQSCGQTRWLRSLETVEEDLRCVSDETLWTFRAQGRHHLIHYARLRLTRQLAAAGASPAYVEAAQHVLNPNALTIGFARRFASYKRPNLLLHDPERLSRLLTDAQRPVQLIIAGKAHPRDVEGKAMVQAWVRFIRRHDIRTHAIFLSDYDMLLAERLVQGVDLWLNTPRRPWEASGTSGMKVLVNGGLNLSELDGWWAEAYTPEAGWALGDGHEHDDDPTWDAMEAEALYTLLEQEVVPAFYTRDAEGIPTAWVARMRESMARLTPRFSTNRMVREYTERYYLPGAAAFRRRAVDHGATAMQLRDWQQALAQHWDTIQFGAVQTETSGDHYRFQVQVYLGEVEPEAVRVELYADGLNGEAPLQQAMHRGDKLTGAANGYLYFAQVPLTRAVTDYTPRVIPSHPEAMGPLEAPYILWQR